MLVCVGGEGGGGEVGVGYGGSDVFYRGEMCVGGTFMSLYDTTFPFLRGYREIMGELVTLVWYI